MSSATLGSPGLDFHNYLPFRSALLVFLCFFVIPPNTVILEYLYPLGPLQAVV